MIQPLKWHGGKHYLAPKIVALMPPRCANPNAPAPHDTGWLHYVEPYFGGGSVLLANDPEGISEVVNDRHERLTEFWKVLQGGEEFEKFYRILTATPFSEVEWIIAKDPRDFDSHPWRRAVRFFVFCRQSHAGRMTNFPPVVKTRTRRGMQEHVSAWLSCVEGLPAVHARLKRVLILNRDALSVIREQDGPRTLFYLDPPYLHETRATTGEYGEHEMSRPDHLGLLNVLAGITGRFLLSGYRSELYDKCAHDYGWNRHDFEIDNKAAGGKTKRRMTECVWANF